MVEAGLEQTPSHGCHSGSERPTSDSSASTPLALSRRRSSPGLAAPGAAPPVLVDTCFSDSPALRWWQLLRAAHRAGHLTRALDINAARRPSSPTALPNSPLPKGAAQTQVSLRSPQHPPLTTEGPLPQEEGSFHGRRPPRPAAQEQRLAFEPPPNLWHRQGHHILETHPRVFKPCPVKAGRLGRALLRRWAQVPPP